MANEFKGRPEHSADSFGDTRDYWWRKEFLEFIARDWKLDGVRTVLDVGCGVGHWQRVLAQVLPSQARITGIDREVHWIEKAAERAAAAGLAGRTEYRVAAVEELPFESGSFDVVTCQTVLMHVADPARAIAEMVRVARPGALILVAEPTNASALFIDSLVLGDSPRETARIVEYQLTCELGRKALGEGDGYIGERLPSLFARAGLTGIEARQNERCWVMLPPYRTARERAAVEEEFDLAERGIFYWDEPKTRRYFLAGGGSEAEFEAGWSMAIARRRKLADAMRAGTFTCTGGALFYLIWGRKE